jgi:hypothetical protein
MLDQFTVSFEKKSIEFDGKNYLTKICTYEG